MLWVNGYVSVYDGCWIAHTFEINHVFLICLDFFFEIQCKKICPERLARQVSRYLKGLGGKSRQNLPFEVKIQINLEIIRLS